MKQQWIAAFLSSGRAENEDEATEQVEEIIRCVADVAEAGASLLEMEEILDAEGWEPDYLDACRPEIEASLERAEEREKGSIANRPLRAVRVIAGRVGCLKVPVISGPADAWSGTLLSPGRHVRIGYWLVREFSDLPSGTMFFDTLGQERTAE